jgi:hypothetical protein
MLILDFRRKDGPGRFWRPSPKCSRYSSPPFPSPSQRERYE